MHFNNFGININTNNFNTVLTAIITVRKPIYPKTIKHAFLDLYKFRYINSLINFKIIQYINISYIIATD